MTFETFKKIAESHRSDIIVSIHGDYCYNKSKNTLGIIFIKDGKKSKVYDYSGTYAEILNKLGVPTITKSDYITAKKQLEYYKEHHGSIGFFTDEVFNFTEEIRQYEQKITEYESDKFVRDWEVK